MEQTFCPSLASESVPEGFQFTFTFQLSNVILKLLKKNPILILSISTESNPRPIQSISRDFVAQDPEPRELETSGWRAYR